MKLAFSWKLPASNLAAASDGSCGTEMAQTLYI
jgi:hypothetical protein